jgi:hypothetical protein
LELWQFTFLVPQPEPDEAVKTMTISEMKNVCKSSATISCEQPQEETKRMMKKPAWRWIRD